MTIPPSEQAVTLAADAIHFWHTDAATDEPSCLCLPEHPTARYDQDRERAVRALTAAVPVISAEAFADERRCWLSVLADHYLMDVICDPETKTDNPVCGCSRVFLGWHPSIGEARQAWIDHVAEVALRLAAADELSRLGEELQGDQP